MYLLTLTTRKQPSDSMTNWGVFSCVFESCCACFVLISAALVCLSVGCVGAGACGAGGQPAAEGSGGREAAGARESPTS